MTRRLAILFISGFWLLMTGLYLKMQLSPDQQFAWLNVPPSHIASLMLNSSEDSVLGIYQGDFKLGTIHVRPQNPEDDSPKLEVNGDFKLELPGIDTQRVYFRSHLGFLPDQSIDSFHLQCSLRNPKVKITVQTSAADRSIKYSVEAEGRQNLSGKSTFDELVMDAPVEIPAPSLQSLQSIGENATITAQRAILNLKGQSVNVYRLNIQHSPDLKTEINVSQLGRILTIETPLGYRLLSDGLEP